MMNRKILTLKITGGVLLAIGVGLWRYYPPARTWLGFPDRERDAALDRDFATKDLNEKILRYTRAIELDPKYSTAYRERGHAHYDEGNYEQAIQDFSRAIGLEPKDNGSYMGRGLVHLHRTDYGLAIVDYTKAIEINPDLAPPYSNRGLCYFRQNYYGPAIRDFTKAIELSPLYLQPRINRAKAYYYLRDHEKAWADLEKYESMGGKPDPEFVAAVRKAVKE